MKRLLLIICTFVIASVCFATPKGGSAKSDTFTITNKDIKKFYAEKYLTKSGNEKERWFAEVSGANLPKGAPKNAHISKKDYTYASDASKANLTVEMLYIQKNGKARVVCGKLASPKTVAPASNKDGDLCVKKIKAVKDGDTFDYISCSGKVTTVRLSGIDTPEKGNKTYCGQPMSQKAKEKLAELLKSGEIRLIRTGMSHSRLVCEVYAGETNVNLELVKAGMAWREPHFDTQGKYLEAEEQARKAKVGIWSQANPLAPWQWRRLTKEEKAKLCK